MDALIWASLVITALVILAPCAFVLGFRLGQQDAMDAPGAGAAVQSPALVRGAGGILT